MPGPSAGDTHGGADRLPPQDREAATQQAQLQPGTSSSADLTQRLAQLLQCLQTVRTSGWGPDGSPQAPAAIVSEVRGLLLMGLDSLGLCSTVADAVECAAAPMSHGIMAPCMQPHHVRIMYSFCTPALTGAGAAMHGLQGAGDCLHALSVQIRVYQGSPSPAVHGMSVAMQSMHACISPRVAPWTPAAPGCRSLPSHKP